MENKNIVLIILLIIILFFISNNKNLTSNSLNNNNAFPLLLILIIFYICYNKFSMSLVFICLLLLLISTTGLKDIIIDRLDYHTDNQFSYRFNELFSSILNKPIEHLDTTEEEIYEDDIVESTEGIDNLSYDDFKQEIGEFNGDSIEQTKPNQPSDQPSDQSDTLSHLDTDANLNKNNGLDVNSMFEELNTKVTDLKANYK
jgi:hypothetical protein